MSKGLATAAVITATAGLLLQRRRSSRAQLAGPSGPNETEYSYSIINEYGDPFMGWRPVHEGRSPLAGGRLVRFMGWAASSLSVPDYPNVSESRVQEMPSDHVQVLEVPEAPETSDVLRRAFPY